MPKKEVPNRYGKVEVERFLGRRLYFKRNQRVDSESETLVPERLIITQRELDLLRLSATGLKREATATKLGISEETAKNVRQSLVTRNRDLNPRRRIDYDTLVVAAYGLGLTDSHIEDELRRI